MKADVFCTLLETHFSTLLLYARKWSIDNAEDIVQEAFVRLLKSSFRENLPEQVLPWLFKTVRNGAIDSFRKKQRRQKHENAFARENEIRFVPPVNSEIHPEDISKMLETLTPEQHEIVIARIWGGLTFDEIAKLVNSSRTSVFRQYTEALQNMRENNDREAY